MRYKKLLIRQTKGGDNANIASGKRLTSCWKMKSDYSWQGRIQMIKKVNSRLSSRSPVLIFYLSPANGKSLR